MWKILVCWVDSVGLGRTKYTVFRLFSHLHLLHILSVVECDWLWR